ncbi:hypothetical protein PVL29_003435 [Vitis rotundifolia]|uniref:SCP domain-containing protein n=1 Tax=Vitis rotundifolia TaxID=103349 RepID=A0AA39E241_VITRO|nr:hypothetical protein PVL29_003435 [Vitis rotundifolia]
MGLCKISSSLVVGFMGLALAHISYAQNSPQDFLDAHNAARAEVGVEPMTWDNTVAAYAQNYAIQRVGDCNLVLSGGPYGENLAWGVPSLTGIDAVNLWVGEKPNYDYNSSSCVGGECLHYALVIWPNSLHLGCATVQCTSGGWFVTCNYDPQGSSFPMPPLPGSFRSCVVDIY